MRKALLASFVLAVVVLFGGGTLAQQPADGPRYTTASELVRPTDYREWTFVTSGLGMTYRVPAPAASNAPRFDNVFVNPSSHRAFMQTGKWPDKTIFILELRTSASEGSINTGGHFQRDIVAVEAAVKDETRFPDKWAYFDFGPGDALKDAVPPLPKTASCYACHTNNTAVEQTFVQFYPTLFEVARRMGTIKPTYNPNPVARH